MSNSTTNIGCFQDQFVNLNNRNSAPDWLKKVRGQGFERFSAIGLPSKRDEEWRFTDISSFKKIEFKLPSLPKESPTFNDIFRFTFSDLDSYLLVFIDGVHNRNLSSKTDLPSSVVVDEIFSIKENNDLVNNHLTQYTRERENAFTALNTAFLNQIAVVKIPSNVSLKKPVHILYVNSGAEEETAIYPRNLILVGDNSRATIIESYVGLGGNCYFNNTVTELMVGEGSYADHYKIQREGENAFHFGTMQVVQNRSSEFISNSITLGSKLTRNTINAVLDDERSECTLNGLYLGSNEQTIDNHTRIDHVKPNCDSHELYKGILEGKSNAVFNGKIYVHPDAQKTDAKQTNRVLLLSDNAQINTKPELEIFADDVKCTHGATVGQLDEEALFYLRSRGLDYKRAYAILTYAFAGEALGKINISEIRDEINELLMAHFH